MEFILRQAHRAGIFGWLYAMNLFFAFHYFSVHFINSSFLAQFLTQTEVGFIFAISSFLTLIILASTVLFLSRIGAYYTALIAVGFDLIASLGLAFSSNTGWLFVFFVLQIIMAPVTLFCFDVFLERYTKGSNSVGFMRGLFLTMSTTASLFAPTISGLLVGSDASYDKVYLLSVLYLIPALILLSLFFRKFDDPHYNVLSLRSMVDTLRTRKNIFHISSAQFLLRFYFSWMVIYLPIYLNKYIGFSWPEIGIILFIMLVPYILIEFPAGILADKWWGEKELLFAGFVIASISTATLFFLDTKSIMVWGGVLFVTRIGAALIESMTETYFFKKVNAEDASVLSIFRMLHSLAYIVGPLSAGLLLLFIDIQFLWLILSGIVLLGVWNALALKDTL